jgi:hypothetical protein
MATSKKYNFKIKQDGATWSAKITRRVSSQRTVISKKQDGFVSEAEAQAWGEKHITLFLDNLNARNKRRSKPRTES